MIILGVLPGIIFWNTYLSDRFSRQVFGASTVAELAWYIVLAVPINALALRALGGSFHLLKLLTVVDVLTSHVGSDMPRLLADLRASWWSTLEGYAVVVFGAWLAGEVLRRLVWALRLDIHIPALRMKHKWFYLLQGRLARLPRNVMPYVDVLATHPDQTEGSRLYRGLVTGFDWTNEGEIKELMLHDAERGKGRGQGFKWVEVPGNLFVLKGANIHTLNMRYLIVNVDPPTGLRQNVNYQVRAFLASFFLGQP